MAHAFETIKQYEEFAEQCEVQASFTTSTAERDYFLKQAATFRYLAAPKGSHASLRTPKGKHSDPQTPSQERTFYEIAG